MTNIILRESLRSKIPLTTKVPSQILRPSDAPIASKTNIITILVKKRVNGFQSLQKTSEAKSEKHRSKNPP